MIIFVYNVQFYHDNELIMLQNIVIYPCYHDMDFGTSFSFKSIQTLF